MKRVGRTDATKFAHEQLAECEEFDEQKQLLPRQVSNTLRKRFSTKQLFFGPTKKRGEERHFQQENDDTNYDNQ